MCGDLPTLENGEILYSSDLSPRAVGTVATHTCNPGFLLEGVVNRTCAESTEFTDSPPICQRELKSIIDTVDFTLPIIIFLLQLLCAMS